MSVAKSRNSGLPATGALSHFSSIIAPLPAAKSAKTAIRPADGFATQPGFLGLDALLAQPIDRGFFVAAGFLQRLLAFHHGQAGALAQHLDRRRGDFSHVLDLLASRYRSLSRISLRASVTRPCGARPCTCVPTSPASRRLVRRSRSGRVGPWQCRAVEACRRGAATPRAASTADRHSRAGSGRLPSRVAQALAVLAVGHRGFAFQHRVGQLLHDQFDRTDAVVVAGNRQSTVSGSLSVSISATVEMPIF